MQILDNTKAAASALAVSSSRGSRQTAPARIPLIRYLGNKRRISGFIRRSIEHHLPSGGTILDLFSGSAAIAIALKGDYRLITNDIQTYNQVISDALVCGRKRTDPERLQAALSRSYLQNFRALEQIFGDVLLEEDCFLNDYHSKDFKEYSSFCERFPYFGSSADPDSKMGKLIRSEVLIRKEQPNSFSHMLFTGYFACGYFSLRQCLEIDSLRFAIAETQNGHDKAVCLAALIYAIDRCVSSTGHFAQFRKINSAISFLEVARERKKSVTRIFYELVDNLFSISDTPKYQNEAWCMDYQLALKKAGSSKNRTVSLVYADPPFTADQYSRYYHVLETLCLYDYPECDLKGRYRAGRFSSGFSFKKNVADEFENLARLSSEIKADLAISYTNDGLISMEKVIQACRKHYDNTRLYWTTGKHSNQGRALSACNRRKPTRREYLLYCWQDQRNGLR